MSEGLWVYAVTRDLDPTVVSGLSGVADAPVLAIAGDGLAAVASPVPIAEFDEEALRRNLEDLDWLAATARAHDAVVAAVAGTAVVPLRLATVYRSEAGVREMLAERRSELRAALDLLTGRTEWGVKAFADPEVLAAPVPRSDEGGAGTAYLRRRRAQLSAREEARQLASVRAEEIHETFTALAVAARRYPPQDRALTGTACWMVLNGAYLVDDTRSADVAATVERLSAELPGVRVELTGPWSPYSFAGLESR